MAAISSALLTVLGAGDHLLAGDCLYGGTQVLITRKLPALGIEHTLIDPGDPASWAAALRPETRAIYVETITNPLMRVGDLDAVGRFAAEHDLVALIDNTFATPVGFRPLEHGFHLSLHSATKYLNGHGDLVAGAVIGDRARVTAVDGTVRLVSPARSSHRALTPEQRAAAGISDALVRVSVGIEGAGDLVADFEQALAA